MSSDVPADGLAGPVQDWIAESHRLRSGCEGLYSSDLVVRRRAARQLSDQLAEIFTAPAPADVVIEDIEVGTSPDEAVRVRRYRPGGRQRSLPSQIWMHGGGFLTGTVEELVNDRICAARAAATGVQILAVEYRLAPEHGYPAPVEDAIAVFDAAVTDPQLGADNRRIGIGGNSAGATIAASTALRIRDSRDTPLVHQLLEVPLVVFKPFGQSMRTFDIDYGPLDPLGPSPKLDSLVDVAQAYLPPGAADQYSVPLHAELAGLPPTLVLTAEYDPLRDGAEAYVTRLRAAGVDAVGIRGDGHLHATSSLTAVWDASRRWQAAAGKAMVDAYGSNAPA